MKVKHVLPDTAEGKVEAALIHKVDQWHERSGACMYVCTYHKVSDPVQHTQHQRCTPHHCTQSAPRTQLPQPDNKQHSLHSTYLAPEPGWGYNSLQHLATHGGVHTWVLSDWWLQKGGRQRYSARATQVSSSCRTWNTEDWKIYGFLKKIAFAFLNCIRMNNLLIMSMAHIAFTWHTFCHWSHVTSPALLVPLETNVPRVRVPVQVIHTRRLSALGRVHTRN